MIKKAVAAVLIGCIMIAGAGCSKKSNNKEEQNRIETAAPSETPVEVIKTIVPETTALPEENILVSEYKDEKNNFSILYPSVFSKENTDYISEDTKFFETENGKASFSITYRHYDDEMTVDDYKDKIENDYDNEGTEAKLIGENEVRFIKSYGDKIMALDAVVKDGNIYQWEMYYPLEEAEDYEKLFDIVSIKIN